ncbi:MAG: leucine-rich repeat domain-containing protein [Alphaproteobacteria bacterium]|nr:leucine-rich repeat domain-containing protein [Alphaproteobacteria bacterium]
MKKWILILIIMPSIAHADGVCDGQDICVWDCAANTQSSCTATLDKTTNTLTLTGYGSIKSYPRPYNEERNFYYSEAPWYEYNSNVQTLTLDGNFTSIGNYTFAHLFSLKKVDLPETLQTIGLASFHDDKNLTDINIPDSVTSIGNYAFSYLGNTLTSIVVPDEATIGNNAFTSSNISSIYCAKEKEDYCKARLAASGWSEEKIGNALKTYQKNGNEYLYKGKFYQSAYDILSGDYIKKRIYTVDEAEKLSKPSGNTFKLRYK